MESSTAVEIPYPQEDKRLQCGRAFHHGRFIMGLRRAALAEPNVTAVEDIVANLEEENGCVTGVQYKDKDTMETSNLRLLLGKIGFRERKFQIEGSSLTTTKQ